MKINQMRMAILMVLVLWVLLAVSAICVSIGYGAQVSSKTAAWDASTTPDVTYTLYVSPADIPVSYASPKFDMGKNLTVDLSTVAALTGKSGIYNLGVTAKTADGNESDITTLNSVALSFLAPAPPAALKVLIK